MTTHKHMIWGMGLLLFTAIGMAYVDELKPDYRDLIELSENQPQRALDALNEVDTADFSNPRKAEHQLVASYLYGNLDQPNNIMKSAEQGLNLIKAQEQPWLFHRLNLALVDAWDRNGTGVRGLSQVEAALQWAENNSDQATRLYAMWTLSQLLIQMEDYNQALQVVQQAYSLAPEYGEDLVKADFSSQMSAIYVYRDEFEIALPYLEETLAHYRREDKALGISIALYELGRANLVLKNTDQGIAYLQESIQMAVAIEDLQGVAYGLNELATHYLRAGDYAQAESYLLEANEKFQQAGNQYMLFDNNIQLSQLYTRTEQFEQAESFLKTASDQVDPELLPYSQVAIKRQQAAILDARGQHDQAYDLLSAALREWQQLEAEQSAEKLHQIRAMFELENSEQTNQLLSQKNQLQEQQLELKNRTNVFLMVLLVAALILVALLIYFTFKFRRQSARLHELANFDDLTGLRNRSNTIYTIKQRLAKAEDHQPLFLVMIDLDHFKDINDQYGHALGDKVLRLFGDYCREILNQDDLVGRVGGEEFLICLSGYSQQEAFELIEALRRKTEQMHRSIKAPELSVTLSAGMCQVVDGNPSFHQWVKCADKALYQAKNDGRNRTVATASA